MEKFQALFYKRAVFIGKMNLFGDCDQSLDTWDTCDGVWRKKNTSMSWQDQGTERVYFASREIKTNKEVFPLTFSQPVSQLAIKRL